MKLKLERVQLDPDVTIGSMSVDGQWECWTLEDVVRPDGVKIHGETAISKGNYDVKITLSPRFKRQLPLIIDVKNFVGIRIHPGNTAGDTEGCILVGQDRLKKSIGRSVLAFNALFAKMNAALLRGEQINLEIT